MTNEQVETVKDKLRQAQNLLREAGKIISDTGASEGHANYVWTRIDSHANDIDDTIDELAFPQ